MTPAPPPPRPTRSRHPRRGPKARALGTGRLAAIAAIAAIVAAGCYTPLDALPEDAIARLDWFFDGESNFGNANFMLESSSCVALNPASTRIALEERPPDFFDGGGRSRDPPGALSAYCGPASAFWTLSAVPDEELRLVLEDDTTALVARFAGNGQVLQCDFPSCLATPVTPSRDVPVPVPAEAP